MVLAILLASREEKRMELPKDTIVDLALFLIPISVLGARIYYVIFAWDIFKDDLLSIFAIWEGGIAIYGALIAGICTTFIFCRFRHISVMAVLDCIVPGLALAQAIGRWGNFFNQEAYGLPVTDPALQFFPMSVQILEGSVPVWHMATFFYESLWDLLVFLFLWSVRKKTEKSGDLFFLYSLLYAAGRLVIEGLRMDSLTAGPIRVSQLIAFLACVLFLFLCLYRKKPVHHPVVLTLPALQLILFLILPRPALESAYPPFLFLSLTCLGSLMAFSTGLPWGVRILCPLLCTFSWFAYARMTSDLSFCLLFSATSLAVSLPVAFHTFLRR